MDKFIIGIAMSMESVALYSIVQFIYSSLSTVGTIPISMYMPQIAKDIASGKSGKELTKTLLPACRIVVFICGTLLFGFNNNEKQKIQVLLKKFKAGKKV